MIKEIFVANGRRGRTVLEYTLFAFRTQKGTFTLTGTESIPGDAIDTFKNLDTGEFHEWSRRSIKKWLDLGKITPIEESTTLDWHENRRRPSKGRLQSKIIRK